MFNQTPFRVLIPLHVDEMFDNLSENFNFNALSEVYNIFCLIVKILLVSPDMPQVRRCGLSQECGLH